LLFFHILLAFSGSGLLLGLLLEIADSGLRQALRLSLRLQAVEGSAILHDRVLVGGLAPAARRGVGLGLSVLAQGRQHAVTSGEDGLRALLLELLHVLDQLAVVPELHLVLLHRNLPLRFEQSTGKLEILLLNLLDLPLPDHQVETPRAEAAQRRGA
jgi:hypothetical protein